jgi:hypothetical protein
MKEGRLELNDFPDAWWMASLIGDQPLTSPAD